MKADGLRRKKMRGHDRPQATNADSGEPGTAGAGQPSDPDDQEADRDRTQGTLATVRSDVQPSGPTLDSARASAFSGRSLVSHPDSQFAVCFTVSFRGIA